MSLELLETVERGTKYQPPKLRVRCPGCGDVYVTRQWPYALRRSEGCRSCGNRRRAK